MQKKTMISYDDFTKVDMRVGKIVEVKDFPEARQPAYILKIDFGDSGIKKSSAQITKNYSIKSLLNKRVIAVVNFPVKQIGPLKSEVLVLGVPDENSDVVLLEPDAKVPIGGRVY